MCWTDSDPFYHEYFPICNIQISLQHVPLSWNIKRFSIQPNQIMLDSGAFSFINNPQKMYNPKEVFEKQLKIADGSTIPTILCHLDAPLSPGLNDTLEIYHRLEKTISNAHQFMELFRSAHLPPNYKSLGVIQGNNYDTISFCAGELKRIGFDQLGIGSLAALYDTRAIVERVKYAVHTVGSNLHVFGVSAINTVEQLIPLGICSFDSSTPMKTAMYNTLLYSDPIRRYGLPYSRIQKNLPVIYDPLPCNCPICTKDPTLIMGVGSKRANNLRAVHNYFHWMRELENISFKILSNTSIQIN